MKKILFCIETLSGGGAEKVLLDILDNLDYTKFDITLVVLNKIGVYIDKVNENVKVKYLNKGIFLNKKRSLLDRLVKNFPELAYRLFIHEKYDVEIAFLEGITTKFISYSNNKQSKKLAWVHTDLLENHWTDNMYKKYEENLVYNKFNNVLFVSKDALLDFNKLFPYNEAKKQVIKNPIISKDIIAKSNEFNVDFNEFTIISVGRLVNEKGYDRLIKAHAKVVKEKPHRLLILGEGSERENLEDIIRNLHVENSVELKGYVENPYPYIKAANIYICSSRAEGYSLVVSEAAVLKKPILSTKVTGPKEILDNGKYGIMCDNSQEGLERGLIKIINNRILLDEYKDKSEIAAKNFDYIKIIKTIENLF